MSSLFAAEYVIYVQYVVAVVVVIAVVLDAFARFCENSARISGRFVFECGIAYSVRRWQVCCQRLQWLLRQKLAATTENVPGTTNANEATFWIGSPEGWLGIDARLQFLHRFDLLKSWNWSGARRPSHRRVWRPHRNLCFAVSCPRDLLHRGMCIVLVRAQLSVVGWRHKLRSVSARGYISPYNQP